MNLYDSGYKNCPLYWGQKPAQLVTEAIDLLLTTNPANNLKAIDLGCGEGKNAAQVARSGITIVGIDSSKYAIEHATKLHKNLPTSYLVADMLKISGADASFDLIISTGSVHCLEKEEEVLHILNLIKRLAKEGALIVFSVFNDRQHDFRGHPEDFNPILLPHSFYLRAFEDCELLHASDQDLIDVHPDNKISHIHSITRILAKKPV